jgi:hypothetical protein
MANDQKIESGGIVINLNEINQVTLRVIKNMCVCRKLPPKREKVLRKRVILSPKNTPKKINSFEKYCN